MSEEFRKVVSNDNYSVSNVGNLLNKKGKPKAVQMKRDGYLQTQLYKDGIRSHERVHRLVAEAFIPNPENKPEVNHINGIKTDNRVENLEWVDKSENMKHAFRTGLNKHNPNHKPMLGHKNPNGGRKGNKVRIVETGELFNSIKECAIAIGGSDRRVCDCLKGHLDSYLGYHFEAI